MKRLLKEERIIVDFLKKYECLRIEQVKELISHKPEDMQESIINGLARRHFIFVDGANVKISPHSSQDQKMLMAFWVFLHFKDEESMMSNFRADYPSNIFFLRKNTPYEIVAIDKGQSNLIKSLTLNNRLSSDDGKQKYIVAVPDEKTLLEAVEASKGLDVIFAIVPFTAPGQVPEVQFLKA